jgi:hypothetical protein
MDHKKQMKRWIARQKSIVRLKDEKGWTFQRIGDKYGMSKQAAFMSYQKGKLREKL